MTMIEKMARAGYEAYFEHQHPQLRTRDWDRLTDHARALWLAIARKSLKSLLPPDEGTVEASLVNEWLSVAEAQACISSFVQHILREDAG